MADDEFPDSFQFFIATIFIINVVTQNEVERCSNLI